MKQSSKKHELGTAALYCRLSRDDNMDSESNSIQNQRKILQKAAKDKGYTDTVFFVDDGITGTTMKRPGFQKMLTAIEAGYISAVFVKDLSRLGRNYIEVGKLTEEFFPLHDIRLVAVSDGVDSDEGEDDFTPFKNIMNEYYAKDISKKRRIVNKMKGNAGVPLSPPPYGYIKNPDDPRFWVVEPEAAEVVRRIYRMALEGYGLAEIAARLAADGVVNPTYYWRSRGTSRGGSKSTVEPTKWGHTTVKKILTLQEYCGDVINFKSYSKSYKMKKRIENPEENRAIFLNVHEAIIDRQTWEKVQTLQKGTRRKKPTVTQEPSVFSGLLKCPECGGNLNFHFNQNNHDIKFFSCQNHNSGYRKCSKTHYIRLDFLEQVVLYEVKRLACFASEYENDFIKAMIGRSAKVAENATLRKQRELDALTARDRELDMLFERLYEDNVAGKIDDARFAKMSKRYEQEQGENAKKIKALRLELKKDESKRMDIDDFLETVRRYTDATTITKRMVAELIDHIEVYHAEKQDGVTNQRVVIHYNCIGAFDVPDRRKIPEADIIMETRKGVALSYAPEQVAV
ncbi:recombinase family protein [Butyricicoccus intestinisimiae]|uniref:Recombinase family protein n=1 Tax=Butyricicoccus intestinisimiae TaxID=2841509 RepID=A0ABS6EUE6_9FIRM|nr:recombinase family protein [Butyricicoccus intestinisimiae]MBU5490781.1 recombinase family protein [Butyricicoccus intestinisimiae]